jgi:ATP-dependent DNA helicase UvrD/PcrA
MNLRNHLNDRQYQAASILEGPVLIIAGAGSGKTRMITYRIAHMLDEGIPQSHILALTFTNKAAREMADRVRDVTKSRLQNLTLSTFHAFGVKVLRECIDRLGFRPNFSIYDQVDRAEMIRSVARELAIPRDSLDLYEVSNIFSAISTERAAWDAESERYRGLYEEYRHHLKAYNAVDFDDLIMLPIDIFRRFPDVLAQYRERYRYLMVDEFQDTSLAQYTMLHLLGTEHRNVCVVGDDDQSIYSWRGANYQNIVNFERDFPERVEIKLEQNYRSTRTILDVANSLIAHNTNRKKKELWTGSDDGTAIVISFPENETAEAARIAELIRSESMREGLKYHDFGVLVRTNGLTAPIEEAFLAENIPYRVSGGTSFFQRKEVKDVLAYLRVLANPDDDVSFLRIINTPRRGFGRRTLEIIREQADARSCSMYSAAAALRWAADSPLPPKTVEELSDFVSLIEAYREEIFSRGKARKMAESVRAIVDRIDYWGYLVTEFQKNDKVAKWKYGNIVRFVDMLERWERDPEVIDPNLFDFLNRITLITRDDDDDDEQGKVNLMTIHAAKGLEFDVVFLPGVEENIIPHARAVEDGNMEEERRLFYVAITRAKRKLYLSACLKRRVMREVVESSPSPFLEELPSSLIEEHEAEQEVGTETAAEYFAKLKSTLQ